MSSDLNPLSHLVLALVGRGGASAHDLVDMLRRGGRAFWSGATSKVYAEPKRLAALGYLAAREEPGRTRPRVVYTLTARGEQALREWIATPASFPRIQNDAAVRLLAGDLVDDAVLLASLAGLRAELDEMETHLAENRRRAATLPHRERYLALLHDLDERQIRTLREWLDTVDARLGAGVGSSGVGQKIAERSAGRATPGKLP